MITAVFILVALLTLLSDWVAYSRSGRKVAVAIVLIVLNIIPVISIALTALCNDNTQPLMHITSWSLTIYTIATLVRIALYFGWFICRSRVVGAVLALTIFAVLASSLINTRRAIVVKERTISHNAIPESFNGFRIALFSDLHIGSLIAPEREISALVKRINEQRADMVIFAGDMLHIRHTELTEGIANILSRIDAPHGVYAVLGNHDTGTYIKDSTALSMDENIACFNTKIGQMGWHLLRDSTIYAVRGRDSLAVTGIDYTYALLAYKHSFNTPNSFSATEIFAQVPDSLFNIAISHLPQLWQPISSSNSAELTLSGHVHATQIAVNIFGKRLSPAMLMYKHWSGAYEDERGNHLYITDGIGSVGFYLRIGANPEITLIELQHR